MAKNRAAFDASAFLPALCDWHEFHPRAAAYLESLFQSKSTILVPEYACIETYSVLTRLPPPFRMPASGAAELLRLNSEWFETIRLPDGRMLEALGTLAESGVAGGRIYDALHWETALQAGARELVTFNPRHFAGLAGDMRIVTP